MKHALIILLSILINDLKSQIPTTGTSTWTHYDNKINLDKLPIPKLDILNNSFGIKATDSGYTSNSYYENSKIGKIKNCKLQVSIEELFYELEVKIEIRTETKRQTLNLINQLNQQFQTPNYKLLNKGKDYNWNKIINNDNIKILLRFSNNYKIATCIIINEIKKIEIIKQKSEAINQETLDLKFLLQAIPDNGWFLKLNKDSTYEYIHLSLWGDPKGNVIEKGKYSITNNLIVITPDRKNSELESRKFYIYTSDSNKIDNNILFIDCVENDSKFYCLYDKNH